MGLTRIRQDNIWSEGSSINDGVSPPDHDANAIDLADTIDYLASQLKLVTGESAWETAPDLSIATMAAKKWLDDVMAMRDYQHMTDVSVPSSQNYVVLTSSGSTVPSRNISLSTSTAGAVCSELAGDVGSHALTEEAGNNALNPLNLCVVVDGTTGDPILSSGRVVYALLQVENGATGGGAFDDTNNQGQLSFVRPNATYSDLEAAAVADIESKTINYVYADRELLSNWAAQDWRRSAAQVDVGIGAVSQSLDVSYDGGSTVTVDDTAVDWRLTDTKHFYVSDSAGSTRILDVHAEAAGDEIDITAAGGVDITGNISLTGNIDAGSGNADFNGVLIGNTVDTVETENTNLIVKAASGQVQFTTTRETTLDLDDSTAGAISSLFSQSFDSVSAAIKYAGEHGGVDMTLGVFTAGSNYAQGVNIPGGAGGLSIASPHSIDLNTPSGVDTLLFLNGRILFGGNVTTKNDVYVGDTAGDGDIKTDLPGGIHTGDVIIALQLVQ
jgi:hypothetical protein